MTRRIYNVIWAGHTTAVWAASPGAAIRRVARDMGHTPRPVTVGYNGFGKGWQMVIPFPGPTIQVWRRSAK